MPAAGGEAVQITKHGGYSLRVSADGEWLFYNRSEGYTPILKMRPDGSDDSIVFPQPANAPAAGVTPNALYALTRTSSPPSYSVQALHFADGKISKLLALDFAPILGLSLTPDERYLLLTKPDQKGTDLMLVEGFR